MNQEPIPTLAVPVPQHGARHHHTRHHHVRRWGLATALVLGLALATHKLGGCGSSADAPPPAPPPAPVAATDAAASTLYAAFPQDRPGFGTTDYPGNAQGDVPKSYAMVLLAETARLGTAWRAGEPNLAAVAGRWLLDHADSNGDGVVGWGLPVAWDAYDDGSINPADTEYTITTAIVIDALLSWAERDGQAPLARIQATVRAAIEPYLDGRNASPSGMAAYSLRPADRAYDTFNPAAYLAGQIQRAAVALREPLLRQRYLDAADATMRAVLTHRRLVPGSGHWYWNYSVQQDLPNDMPHAGYMIDGIRTYIEHGGRLAEQFDWVAVLAHLADFKPPLPGAAGASAPAGGQRPEVQAFPVFYTLFGLQERPARAYDLGFALHLACTETRTEALVPWLLGAVPAYRATEGAAEGRYLKFPRGTRVAGEAVPPLVINEYEAYLYRGLAACALRPSAGAATGATVGAAAALALAGGEALRQHAHRLAGEAARPGDAVPLLPMQAGTARFDAGLRATATLPDGRTLAFAAPGVPVQVLARDDTTAYVFYRQHPDDQLVLSRFNGTQAACRDEVNHGTDPTAVAALRAATLHRTPEGERLHAVVYHNPSQANWLLSWDLSGACPVRVGTSRRLTSMNDPAGGTYEMIASLRFYAEGAAGDTAAPGGAALWLAGGNVQMKVAPTGELREVGTVPGCRIILESTLTPAGLAHLCVGTTPTPGLPGDVVARPLVIVAPEGVAAPDVVPAWGVPWRLQWSLGALQIDHAATPRQLRAMLRRDLALTAPGGWMEYGINNEEGRIPWSQIYALNGLLDILDLAARDARAFALYGPLLAEVRARLDMEVALIDAHVAAGRHRTRAFTVDRSRALFGVQTGRFLLLLHRYRTEVPGALPTPSFEPLRSAVQRLEGHIEVLATSGEEPRWIRPGFSHLRWPRGSAFIFDGMPVPFNHQNEWAYAVLAAADAGTPAPVVQAATEVLQHFVDRLAPAGTLPAAGAWDYWWGRAYDGWTEADGYSVNMPRYGGDKIKAWISFRTIDAMSLAAGAGGPGGTGGPQRLGAEVAANTPRSAQGLAERGLLYPFANHAWVRGAGRIHLHPAVAQEYARVSAPWELNSAAWSLVVLAAQGAPGVAAPAAAPAPNAGR